MSPAPKALAQVVSPSDRKAGRPTKWLGICLVLAAGCLVATVVLVALSVGGYFLYNYLRMGRGEALSDYGALDEDYWPEEYEDGYESVPIPSPSPLPPSPAPAPSSSSRSDREQLIEAAREYVRSYSAPGMEVDIEIQKQLDRWALLSVTPTKGETDSAGVIMEKVGGKWVGRAMGTYFEEEWYDRVPELFDFE